jgi:Na+-translocating ferredoxin:NAD+ oxidoreductase RnfG subunit
MRELLKLTLVLTIICVIAATALAFVYTITKEPILL